MGIYYNSAQGACLDSNYDNVILRVSLSLFKESLQSIGKAKRFIFNFEITPDDSYVPTLLVEQENYIKQVLQIGQ